MVKSGRTIVAALMAGTFAMTPGLLPLIGFLLFAWAMMRRTYA